MTGHLHFNISQSIFIQTEGAWAWKISFTEDLWVLLD